MHQMQHHVTSLVDLLRLRSTLQGDQRAYTFLRDGEQDAVDWTYHDVHRRAQMIAGWLQELGLQGERILLLYQPGLDYISAFFGCLYAGAVAVPAYPPRNNRNLMRIQSIVADAQAAAVLTTSSVLTMVERQLSELPGLRALKWLSTDNIPAGAEAIWRAPAISADSLAFLQYTSGSTGVPKGVMLSHGNLLKNLSIIAAGFEATEADEGVIWLPPYHDMGLIGGILQPLHGGFPCTLMSPVAFLQRPVRWLQAISRCKATISGGPNFAFELLVQKTSPEERESMDLSTWNLAFTGAEPVRKETLDRFVDAFGMCGFRREAFYPCYGLAETTLFATGSKRRELPVTKALDRSKLAQNQVGFAAGDDGNPHVVTGCGVVGAGHRIEIVDPSTLRRCPPDRVGEIWLGGPSVGQGYWNRSGLSQEVFGATLADEAEGSFLRTGDMGFLSDGELFVTGRLKDMIILRGRNYYPQDLEHVAEQSHPGLRPGCGAAFAVDEQGEERLVMIHELERHVKEDPRLIVEAIRKAVAEEFAITVHTVQLIKTATIPKTSSGKIQRYACREGYLAGTLDVLYGSALHLNAPLPAQQLPADVGLNVQAVLSVAPAGRVAALTEHLRVVAGKVLRIAVGEVELATPLTALGLDSLAAVALAHALETELGVVVPFIDLLQGPSVRALAELVNSRLDTGAALDTQPESVPSTDASGYELSHGQKALWFLHEVAPESSAYQIARAVRIRSALDRSAFRRALQLVVDRHGALRTRFAVIDGDPLQRTDSTMQIDVVETDAAGWSDERLADELALEANRPFDLVNGPLLRVHLFRCSATESVLLVVVHHIVTDLWSLSLFLEELGALYSAELSGTPCTAATPGWSYSDFVRWQQGMLSSPVGDRQLQFWKECLPGELPVLELPTDRPRPPVQTYRGARCTAMVGAELLNQLKSLGRQEGATLYTTLLAAFFTQLSRYSGQKDILIGTPAAGRQRPELANLLGYCVNPVVVRANTEGNPGFTAFLAQVRNRVLAALQHQDLPFSMLVEQLEGDHDPSRSPLFQAMFVLQKVHNEPALAPLVTAQPGARLTLGGLELEVVEAGHCASQFDLTLMATEVEDGLSLMLEYNTDLFDQESMARFLSHFTTLLHGIVQNPVAPLSVLPLLSADERKELTAGGASAPVNEPEVCLHTLVEAQAVHTPLATAVRCGDRLLTYAALDAQANRLANRLCAEGVGPETLVGICMERSVEMVVGLLGIMKAGGAYVPLDPTYPAERVAYMIADSGVRVLLTQQRLQPLLSEYGVHTICLDGDWADGVADGAQPTSDVRPSNLAYVIYTSGSTGKPKGVQIEHRAIVNHMRWMQATFPLSATHSVLQKTPFSFDASVWEFWAPLLAGAQLIMAEPHGHQDPAYLVRTIQCAGISRLQVVPSLLHVLVEEAYFSDCSTLTHVFCGGEALPGELVARFHDALPAAQLYNLYGPTEATIDATFHLCEPGAAAAKVAIGRPVWNTQVYVLDEGLQPVPIGVAGELYIGGTQLARGYLNQPELTDARFVASPFTPGTRLYRTGDLGRRLASGALEYLGRVDQQVKVRGFRIELGEIETTLSGCAGVKQAAVTEHVYGPGDMRLVAYIVRHEGSATDAQQLRSALKAQLPEYMVPFAFTFLDALPTTPNGKLDRRALPAPDSAPSEALSYTAPRTPAEETLAAIWADVLAVGRVGADDNFFELGGHSLLAMRMMARVRAAFQQEVPLRALYDHPTVAGMAQVIARTRKDDTMMTWVPALVEAPDDRSLPFPLTDVQQAYWIGRSGAWELGNVSTHTYLEIESRTADMDRMERVWNCLIQRHEMLRAVILPDGTQQILPEVSPYRITQVDLRDDGPDGESSYLESAREHMSHHVFKPDQWPLFEVRAYHLQDGRTRLCISLDTLISDAVSLGILAAEWGSLIGDPEQDLEPLTLSFRDYVISAGATEQTDAFKQDRDYWLARINELPPSPELPLAKSLDAVPRPRFSRLSGLLDQHTWARLKSKAARTNTTATSVLLTAFADVLAAWSKAGRFTLNLTLFNRLPLHPQVNDIVGDFTSVSLLAVDQSEGTFVERAQRTQRQLWEDLDHNRFSGVQVLREIARAGNTGRKAIFPVVFTSILGQDLSGVDRFLSAVGGELVFHISQTSQVYLDHQVYEQNGELVFYWDVVAELFPDGLLAEMFDTYCATLRRLAAGDVWDELARPLPETFRRQVDAVNATDVPVPEGLLHTPFLERARENPDQMAVISNRRALTYGALARHSAQVGHRLRAHGAKPDQLVAVVMEKGWEQVVAVLGILQAGAAYLPIDPTVPEERLRYLLEHSAVSLVLTQSWISETLAWPDFVTDIVVDSGEWTEPEYPLEPVQTPENLAYVIFTSGSTGLPKGVMIDHRGALNTVCDMNQRFQVGPADRVLAVSALNFDLSVYDIFGTLAAGGTIVMPNAAALRDPSHWAEQVHREGVTVWNSVPALMNLLVEYAADRPDTMLHSLRLVLLSGDWIPVTLPDQVRRLTERARVVSLGGATEASIWSILYPIDEVDPAWKSIPYGTPMRNQRFYVLNDRLELCPAWVSGELYIGGVGLAKGYWRDPAKTAASFFCHPKSGDRLYRTGDLGRYRPDGTIEFLGREDFQVKVQGYRIELGEIETALERHEAIRQAVVTAIGSSQAEKRLVGYVVPADAQQPPSLQDMRRYLMDRLPAYMVPAAFVVMDALPLTANGKVDRKRLPAPSQPVIDPAPRPDMKTTGGIREEVLEIVARVLQVQAVDPDVELSYLGVNSVDMMRIANHLEKRFGFRPDMGEIFRIRDCAGLVAYYEQRLVGTASSPENVEAADRPRTPARMLLDPEEREAFKQQQPGIRHNDGVPTVQLPGTVADDSAQQAAASRYSCRHFDWLPVTLAELGRLLECLRQFTVTGRNKYLYASAGALYPVQAYVHVKPGGVDGLAPGVYYYHPLEHRLERLSHGTRINRGVHYPTNQPIYDEAQFSLFLIGQMSAIEPIYGERARDFSLLEAGMMAQLLMTVSPTSGIGLCPVGTMDFDHIRQEFALAESHVLLHTLLGGRASANSSETGFSFLSEAVRAKAEAEEEWEETSL